MKLFKSILLILGALSIGFIIGAQTKQEKQYDEGVLQGIKYSFTKLADEELLKTPDEAMKGDLINCVLLQVFAPKNPMVSFYGGGNTTVAHSYFATGGSSIQLSNIHEQIVEKLIDEAKTGITFREYLYANHLLDIENYGPPQE